MKHFVQLTLLALVVCLLCSAAFAETWADTYARGMNAWNEGKVDEAIELFDSVSAYQDSAIRVRQLTAEKLFDAGKYAQAWDIFASLETSYHTRDAEYADLYTQAVEFRTAKDYEQAQALFTALGGYSDSFEQVRNTVLRSFADKAYENADYVTAEAMYKDLGEAELFMQSGYMRAKDLTANGEYLSAADLYTEIYDYRDSKDQHYAVGLAALNAGRVSEAWEILMYDTEYKDPRDDFYTAAVNATAQNNLSVAVPVYQLLGNYKDCTMRIAMFGYTYANQLYEEGEYLQAGNVFNDMGTLSDAASRKLDAWYRAANAKFDVGAYAEAKELYALVPGYENSDKRTKSCEGYLLMEDGEYQKALDTFVYLGKFENSTENANECRYQLAAIQMNDGRYADAAEAFDAIEVYRDSSTQAKECRYKLAVIAQDNAMYIEASNLYDIIPGYKDSAERSKFCHYNKGVEYETEGKLKNAYNEYLQAGGYENAVEKYGEMATALALNAQMNMDYELAINWYVKAGEYPNAAESIEFIGEYYFMTAQYELAMNAFIKAVKLDAAIAKLYELGQYFEKEGNFDLALTCFENTIGYLDGEDKYQQAKKKYLQKKWSVGQSVTFGTYPQTTTGMDNTPIEWLVLARDGDQALVISKYALDAVKFYPSFSQITWAASSVRKWLNNNFYNKAFSTDEKGYIILSKVTADENPKYHNNPGNDTNDNVFLLSITEVNKYVREKYRKCVPTEYAIKNGAHKIKNEVDGQVYCSWWLRSPGMYSTAAAKVGKDGVIDVAGNSVHDSSICVRPCVWVRIF